MKILYIWKLSVSINSLCFNLTFQLSDNQNVDLSLPLIRMFSGIGKELSLLQQCGFASNEFHGELLHGAVNNAMLIFDNYYLSKSDIPLYDVNKAVRQFLSNKNLLLSTQFSCCN